MFLVGKVALNFILVPASLWLSPVSGAFPSFPLHFSQSRASKESAGAWPPGSQPTISPVVVYGSGREAS